MFSSNKFKINFVVILFALLCNACGFWRSADNQNSSTAPTPSGAAEVKSEIPFSTKEPDIYQADIIVTTGVLEEKMFTARNGNYRRYDFTSANNSLISLIQNAGGDKRLVNYQKKNLYRRQTFRKFYRRATRGKLERIFNRRFT